MPKIFTPDLMFPAVRSLSPAIVNSENTLPAGGLTISPAAVGGKDPVTSVLAGLRDTGGESGEGERFFPCAMSPAIAVVCVNAWSILAMDSSI